MIDIGDLYDKYVDFHKLKNLDNEYTFYHDETNNIRKLYIKADRLNVTDLGIFILGGVVHRGAPRSLEIWSLRKSLGVQENAREIKLKHVGKGTFLELISLRRFSFAGSPRAG